MSPGRVFPLILVVSDLSHKRNVFRFHLVILFLFFCDAFFTLWQSQVMSDEVGFSFLPFCPPPPLWKHDSHPSSSASMGSFLLFGVGTSQGLWRRTAKSRNKTFSHTGERSTKLLVALLSTYLVHM